MTSKQPRRSNLKSYLKFMAQTTYATMFVWTDLAVLKLFLHLFRRKKKNQLTFTRPVGFAAGKNVGRYDVLSIIGHEK